MVQRFLLSYSKSEQIFYIYILLVSLIGFILMGMDKYKATRAKWRIQELTFIIIAFIGGSIGILFGMIIFKHKINKKKFYIGVPLLYILNIIINHVVIYYVTSRL